jgi:hypothetical protein
MTKPAILTLADLIEWARKLNVRYICQDANDYIEFFQTLPAPGTTEDGQNEWRSPFEEPHFLYLCPKKVTLQKWYEGDWTDSLVDLFKC